MNKKPHKEQVEYIREPLKRKALVGAIVKRYKSGGMVGKFEDYRSEAHRCVNNDQTIPNTKPVT